MNHCGGISQRKEDEHLYGCNGRVQRIRIANKRFNNNAFGFYFSALNGRIVSGRK